MSSPTAPQGARDASIDPIEALKLLLRHWWQVTLVPLALGLAALGITFLIPPTFTASTSIMPPAQQSSSALSAIAGQLGALGGLAGMGAALKSPTDQYVSFLKSRNVSDRVIANFGLLELYDAKLLHDARLELSKNVRFAAGKKDGLLVIEVDDHDPKRAADMANAFVDELRRLNSELAVGEASQRRAFFEAQMKSARTALTAAEDALNASGVSASTMNTAPQAAVAAVAKLKANITAQEVKIASMQGFVTEDNPDLRQARLELAALRAQLTQSEEGSPAGTVGDRSRYTERYRDFKYQEMLFELMAKQYELARLDEAREGNVIQVLDLATPPEVKSKPKRAMTAMATTLLAALVVCGYLIGRDWLRRRSA